MAICWVALVILSMTFTLTQAQMTAAPGSQAETTAAPGTLSETTVGSGLLAGTIDAPDPPGTGFDSTAVTDTQAKTTAVEGTLAETTSAASGTLADSTAASGTLAETTAASGTLAETTSVPGTSADSTSASGTKANMTTEGDMATSQTKWTSQQTDLYPCQNLSLGIPLMDSQRDEIANASMSGLIERLRSDREFTYNNRIPIVTKFSDEQVAVVRDSYSILTQSGSNEDLESGGLQFWSDDPPPPTPMPDQCSHIDSPITRSRRRKRNTHTGTQPSRVCPVNNVRSQLITAFNADGDPLQIVQIPGIDQWVLRQPCRSDVPVVGDSSISCAKTIRLVYLVAIRLDLDEGAVTGIQVQRVQVESCTSISV